MKLGDDTDDKIVEDKITAQKPEDHCTLIYTVSVLICGNFYTLWP